jgi:AcrR family transcriptional regulator
MTITVHPRLLAEAERLFSTRGYLSTSLSDISDAAQLPVEKISKEELLWQSALGIANAFISALDNVLAVPRPVDDRLRHAIMAHINVIVENLNAANVYMHEWRYLSDDRRREYLKRRDEYEAKFREMVSEGIHAGIFSPVDEKLVTLMLLSSLNWVSQWYNPRGELTPIDIGHTLADLTLNGLYRHV